jgi:hypothetical protein
MMFISQVFGKMMSLDVVCGVGHHVTGFVGAVTQDSSHMQSFVHPELRGTDHL